MMKRIFPYPLLFITAIIFDRVAMFMSQIDPAQSLRPLFVLLFLGAVASFIIQRFTRDWHRTDFMAFMIVMLFVLYRSLFGLIARNFPQQADYLGIALIPFLGWLYTIVTSRKLWRCIREPAQVTYYFQIVGALLLMFQVARLGWPLYARLKHNRSGAQLTAISPLTGEIRLKGDMRPDIYIIVLDAYGRRDVLQSIYDYDNSGFIKELEKRGFYVPTENHSNYVQTSYALASLWNFDYVQSWAPPSDYRQYLLQPIQDNRAFQLLDEIGYTTVSFEGALSYTQIEKADIYMTNSLPLNKFEALTLVNSPLEPLSNIFDLGIPVPTYKTHRTRVLYKLETLKKVPESVPGPKIVFAHFLSPHPPFVFDRNGDALPQRRPYSMWDDSETAGGEEEYRHGYREQVIFMNRKIIETIDGILAKSETPPVILVMGDHGPASMFDFDINEPGCVWERTGNLYALRLPRHENDGTLYPTISPVNTFRVIFNAYFDADLPLLEDRTYLAAAQYRDKIKDVTDGRDSLAGCTVSDWQITEAED